MVVVCVPDVSGKLATSIFWVKVRREGNVQVIQAGGATDPQEVEKKLDVVS